MTIIIIVFYFVLKVVTRLTSLNIPRILVSIPFCKGIEPF